jgi:NTP pyrophosphatase (non-canonical NTP hydrolase)
MEFKTYQELAKTTAIYPERAKVYYPCLGLAGEVGEVLEKVKKSIRDNTDLSNPLTKAELTKELGDVLWYLAAVSSDLDISLEDVAVMNYEKLKSRSDRNVLQGSGDNR